MSQYLKIKCTALSNVKVPVLKKAIKKMNSSYDIVGANKFKNISNFGMDALLTIDKNPTTIGFKFTMDKKGQTKMEIGGEFYRTGFDLAKFTKDVCYNYSLELVNQMIKQNNYKTVKQKVDEDGTIHMTVKVAA